ncbi:MAG: hypothetical protein DRI57_17030 [Deltaproteobacteria bacterium]|nr:MAG: hypothetical protein DRI57_17030 [Deltaproteobacteria bacterium]
MDDLWPENLAANRIKSPVTILKEQASLLGQKTQNAVQAQVRSIEADYQGYWETLTEKEMKLRYEFCILAPGLGNYRYKLFTISHNVDLYPVIFNLDEGVAGEMEDDRFEKRGTEVLAKSEKEFSDMLKEILRSERTKEIIQVLFSQSTDMHGDLESLERSEA